MSHLSDEDIVSASETAVADAVVALSDVDAAVSHVGYALSDLGFVFPGNTSSSYLGQHASNWASRGGRNANGDRGEVRTVSTRSGAGGIVVGALSASSAAVEGRRRCSIITTYAPSSALSYLQPSIAEMVSLKLPGVLHVLARSTSTTTSNAAATSTDHASLLAAMASSTSGGGGLYVSGRLQEVHDLAILAHGTAIGAKAPVVHAVDAGIADDTGSVKLTRYHELQNFAKLTGSSSSTSISEAAAATMKNAVLLVGGKLYKPFEYQGHAAPTTVLVAIGSGGATAADTAVALALTAEQQRVGVIRPLLVSPFDPTSFLAALPSSVTRVAVISFVASTASVSSSSSSWLFTQVSAAINSSSVHKNAITTLRDWQASTDAVFSPHHAMTLFARLSNGQAPSSFVLSSSTSENTPPLQLAYNNSKSESNAAAAAAAAAAAPSQKLRVWGLGNRDGSAAAARATVRLLSSRNAVSGGSVSGHFVTGTFSHGEVGVATLQVNNNNGANCNGDETVDAVLVTHMSLTRDFDIFASLRIGGTVVLNSTSAVPMPPPSSGIVSVVGGSSDGDAASMTKTGAPTSTAEVLASLTDADKNALISRSARVFVIDASGLARTHKLGGHEDLILQAAFVLASSASRYAHLIPLLEGVHRGVLSTDKHSSLVKLYSNLKSLLAQPESVPAPATPAGTQSPPSPPRRYLPIPSLNVTDASTTTFGNPEVQGSSPLGLGPSEWSTTASAATLRARSAAVSYAVAAAASSGVSSSSPESASSSVDAAYLRTQHKQAALALAFPDAFSSVRATLPSEEGVFVATVSENRRLTPLDYDRNVFHIEMDISNTGLKYQIGSALGVYGQNLDIEVDQFLAFYGLDGNGVVSFEAPAAVSTSTSGGGASSFNTSLAPPPPSPPSSRRITTSVRRLVQQDLDLFGKPTKEYYAGIAKYASNPADAKALAFLGSDAGLDDFTARETEGCTYADALYDYPSTKPPIEVLIASVPRIKARHYSIASSMRAHPTSVHLLVVEVEWQTPKGKTRHGQCSSYLARLSIGAKIAISVLPSEMHLPPDNMSPVVMAGLGTGMAPFRAFIQERASLKASGQKVAPMILYFGSRFRAKEYLYGDELEEYAKQGLLTLRLAFSRDSAKKVYIQHLMMEDAKILREALLGPTKGQFYLCGPTWPEPDVEEAITQAFSTEGKLGREGASGMIRVMKDAKRYVLEVY